MGDEELWAKVTVNWWLKVTIPYSQESDLYRINHTKYQFIRSSFCYIFPIQYGIFVSFQKHEV